jgi:predicted Zn-dependent protease
VLKPLRTLVLTLACALAAPLAAAQQPLPSLGDVASDALTRAQERELGRRMMTEVRRQLPLLDDPEVVAYIRDLGQRLATHSDAPEFDYRFFVVDSPSVNAFAMPGGYIGINSGLILAARSESELAGVLAHEIAHVTQRHIARQLQAAQRINLQSTALLLASILIGMQDPQAGSAAAVASMAGGVQQQLNYSRAYEHEADNLGIRMLAAAGLDPNGMPAFFERLAQSTRYQNRPPEYLMTHPVTDARIAESASRAGGTRPKGVFESEMFRYMQQRLRVLQAGEPQVAEFRAEAERASQVEKPAARYGLALALAANREYDQARGILEQLIRSEGEQPSLLSARARLEQDAGEHARSRQLYEQALKLFPSSQPLRIGYAELLLAMNQPAPAYWALNRALPTTEPTVYWLLAKAAAAAGMGAEPQLAMAEYYELRGDLDAALNQLQQVVDNPRAAAHEVARASARRDELQRALRRLAQE